MEKQRAERVRFSTTPFKWVANVNGSYFLKSINVKQLYVVYKKILHNVVYTKIEITIVSWSSEQRENL